MKAIEDQQRIGDAETEAGHRGERDGDRVGVYHLAEQRHQPVGGEHRARAEQRHDRRGERGAQRQREQQEQDSEGDQL